MLRGKKRGDVMTNQIDGETIDILEELMDKFGIVAVIDVLARLCLAKEQHVTSNWQDKNLAELWTKRMMILDMAATKLDKLGG